MSDAMDKRKLQAQANELTKDIKPSCDCNANFESELIKNGQTRTACMDR